jgi:hypothetical protein
MDGWMKKWNAFSCWYVTRMLDSNNTQMNEWMMYEWMKK